jgi:vacuolar-type H+-ATPase subunit I/STV1
MKVSKSLLICGFVALSLIIGACAKPPTEEMNNAAAAVTRAENDTDAVTYAGSTLSRARDALSRMQTEAESKRYDAAKTSAAEAIAAADKAIADGRSGAVRAQEEAASLVEGLTPAIAETEQAIRSARAKGNVQLDFNSVNQDFAAARLTADQAAVSLAGNNYQDALDKGRSARAGLSDINARVSSAATAASRKK